MLDPLITIPGRKRLTPSGWHVFNAVCCHHRGHNPDRRQRAGVKFSDTGNWSYSCFNCGFKCGLHVGKHFSTNLKQLLLWAGVDSGEIERLSFQSFSQRTGIDQYLRKKEVAPQVFKEVELPGGARPLDPDRDVLHIEYLRGRGLSSGAYPFYVVDGESRVRLIIPYYWRGKVVGNTSRYYDGRHPKYVSESQRGYVFNIDRQMADWSVCILVEGQFDAISIDGCSCMGSTITDEQAATLRGLNRKIIYVPDRDKTGLDACSRALELGYSVSIPEWGPGIKDVNDAVCKYGKLPTLLSILEAQSTSRVVVELKRKKLL